jgi:glucose/arabinose dehydrogenase
MNLRSTVRAMFAVSCLYLFSTAALALPAGFQEETVVGGREQPIFLAVLPDGRMLLLHKQGLISIFDPSQQPTSLQTYMEIPSTAIETGSERGLTSMAVDPDFENNNFIYVYYTHKASKRNRISRFTHQGSTASVGSELMIWQDSDDWTGCCHYGGGIGFGPDGKLYLTTGDEWDTPANSQDLAFSGGKIIRINNDGSIPGDNPFVDGPGGNLDEVWAYGLRNPYRASWDLPTNRFLIGDVGGNIQPTAREEINVGKAGANYGWPNCEGQCGSIPSVEKPIFDYGHTSATPNGGAVTAGFVYRGSQYPTEYNEKFFYTDYVRQFIRMLTFNANGTVASDTSFETGVGSAVHLVQGADDAMYVVDYGTGSGANDGRVFRYTYSDDNQAPDIQAVSASPQAGQAPLSVNFSVTATDAENDTLDYRWVFGDGTESTTQNPTHNYTTVGTYPAYVEVSDGSRSAFSQTLQIQVGNVPDVQIISPVDPNTLSDELRAKDMTPRQRKPIREFVFSGKWGQHGGLD